MEDQYYYKVSSTYSGDYPNEFLSKKEAEKFIKDNDVQGSIILKFKKN